MRHVGCDMYGRLSLKFDRKNVPLISDGDVLVFYIPLTFFLVWVFLRLCATTGCSFYAEYSCTLSVPFIGMIYDSYAERYTMKMCCKEHGQNGQ